MWLYLALDWSSGKWMDLFCSNVYCFKLSNSCGGTRHQQQHQAAPRSTDRLMNCSYTWTALLPWCDIHITHIEPHSISIHLPSTHTPFNNCKCADVFYYLHILVHLLSRCRLFSAASSDSIRFHSNLSSQNDPDLRVSIDNTCTDSLVTALDDEALLLTESFNDMSKSKVEFAALSADFNIIRPTIGNVSISGPFWWCVPVWDTEGGATAQHASGSGEDVVEFYQKPTPVMVSANRQSARDEIVR